jgi:hypothetical protein
VRVLGMQATSRFPAMYPVPGRGRHQPDGGGISLAVPGDRSAGRVRITYRRLDGRGVRMKTLLECDRIGASARDGGVADTLISRGSLAPGDRRDVREAVLVALWDEPQDLLGVIESLAGAACCESVWDSQVEAYDESVEPVLCTLMREGVVGFRCGLYLLTIEGRNLMDRTGRAATCQPNPREVSVCAR